PSLVGGDRELVTANSRLAIIAVVGGLVRGLPAVGVYKLFGAEGSLILAALVYALAAMLSWQIPRVEGEQAGPDTEVEQEDLPAVGAVLFAAGAAAGRVAFDSLPPRDAPDAIRGRSFARFDTRFQITWVAGALIPVAIPPVYQDLRIGLFVLAIGLGFAGLSY